MELCYYVVYDLPIIEPVLFKFIHFLKLFPNFIPLGTIRNEHEDP